MSHETDCIFCRIVRGEIPSHSVLETDDVLAFLDVSPLTPGHTLVIPKAHFASLSDLPDALAAATAAALPRICRAVRKATRADGLNVLVNTGRVAGQSVDHVHWHVIPRHAGDPIHWPWPAQRLAADAMTKLREAIQTELS
jgi:histidine triad (HIT) family protein